MGNTTPSPQAVAPDFAVIGVTLQPVGESLAKPPISATRKSSSTNGAAEDP